MEKNFPRHQPLYRNKNNTSPAVKRQGLKLLPMIRCMSFSGSGIELGHIYLLLLLSTNRLKYFDSTLEETALVLTGLEALLLLLLLI